MQRQRGVPAVAIELGVFDRDRGARREFLQERHVRPGERRTVPGCHEAEHTRHLAAQDQRHSGEGVCPHVPHPSGHLRG